MAALLALRTDAPKICYSYKEVENLLPPDKKRLLQNNKEKLRGTTHALFMWTITQSGHFLDSACAAVLRAVIARTYGYYKEAELISARQLYEGIWRTDTGSSVCAPALRNKRAVYKALSILEKVGYITKTRITINASDVTSLVVLNANIVLADVKTQGDIHMLRRSRREKREESEVSGAENSDFYLDNPNPRVVHMCTTREVPKCTTEIKNKEEKKITSSSQAQNVKRISRTPRTKLAIDCNTTATDAIAMAVARVTERRDIKARRTRAGGVPEQEALRAMWQSAIVAKYGFSISAGLTGKQYGMFKRIAGAQHVEASWGDIILWSVKNWETINREHREFLTYKKKQGDWSSADEKRLFLGSERPDLYCFIMGLGKFIKRYTDYKLKGKALTIASDEEVATLKQELHATRLKVASAQASLSKVLSGRATDAEDKRTETRRRADKVVIVDPSTDKFFEQDDVELPEWN